MARHHICIALSALAFGLPAQAQTVFKCTSASGAVTLQQTPCDNASASSAKVYSGRQAPPQAAGAPQQRTAAQQQGSSSPPPRRHWIVWTNDPQRDAALAAANLDAIRLLGQSCEAGLRARGSRLDDCPAFLQELAPGGNFGRIETKANELAQTASGSRDVYRIGLIAQDIGRIKDFVMVALAQR